MYFYLQKLTESRYALNDVKTPDTGLSSAEAASRQIQYGKNSLIAAKPPSFCRDLLRTITEPMFLLLIIAATIYFILGEPRDGAIMLVFVVVVIAINAIQEWKTDKTLKALHDLTEPSVTVIRDGRENSIASAELVPGDLLLMQEGMRVPADCLIIRSSDLRMDESALTGEAEGVWKTAVVSWATGVGSSAALNESAQQSADYWRLDRCYAGTLVQQGSALLQVEKIGLATEYGKISSTIVAAPPVKTPLQQQIGGIVKISAGIAAVLFALVSALTWFNLTELDLGGRLVGSLLGGVTLAMAMIPEEFPVILTVFLSLGAWRLAKKQSLVRNLPSAETLGAITVLCVDKTGTLTLNQMSVQAVNERGGHSLEQLTEIMGLACETETYDPMEQAMLSYCTSHGVTREHLFSSEFLSEYAFTDDQKMMGHVWRHEGHIVIAAKGSPEHLLELCQLNPGERQAVEDQMEELAVAGLRVIAVADGHLATESEIPSRLADCRLNLCGLIGLADLPRPNIQADIQTCQQAGIRVVMITGDNGHTAAAIGRQIGLTHLDQVITGSQLDQLSDSELQSLVADVGIFARVIPEQKLRIVQALQAAGEIVAMTGDGVNDAPALKYADIGIAMGGRGSEVAREAADLVLLDDNFSTIVETVRDGRRIYDNIRKAIGYVFSIHMPIALAALLAPALGIAPNDLLFLPLQVVVLELIIDPTCSIVLERQPAESDVMRRPPRGRGQKLLDGRLLLKSLILGLAIGAAAFGAYYLTLTSQPEQPELARSMGLAVIILANLFLILELSSEIDSIFVSDRRLFRDGVMWVVLGAILVGLALILYSPLNNFLRLAPLSAGQVLIVIGLAAASVLWFEFVKLYRRRRARS